MEEVGLLGGVVVLGASTDVHEELTLHEFLLSPAPVHVFLSPNPLGAKVQGTNLQRVQRRAAAKVRRGDGGKCFFFWCGLAD